MATTRDASAQGDTRWLRRSFPMVRGPVCAYAEAPGSTTSAPLRLSAPVVLLEMLMREERWPEFMALTSVFMVELPGIEPGSYGIPSRLLRAQFAMSLLGSPAHANKSG